MRVGAIGLLNSERTGVAVAGLLVIGGCYGSRGGVTFNGLLLRAFRKATISEISEKLLPSNGSTSSGMPSGVVVGTLR